jgi:hypothetical protein
VVTAYEFNIKIFFSSLATSTFLYQSYTLPRIRGSLIYIFPSF